MLRRREIFIDRYGPVAGPKLYRALQSQAAHAGVNARLRRKLEAMSGAGTRAKRDRRNDRVEVLPLFPDEPPADGDASESTPGEAACGAGSALTT